MPSSPAARSLALLRREAYSVAITERWCAYARRRIDLFNAFDLVAIRAGSAGVLAVQTTSNSNLSARRHKLIANANVKVWLQAGNAVELHGWCKRGGRWHCRRVPLTLEDMRDELIAQPNIGEVSQGGIVIEPQQSWLDAKLQ